MKIIKIKFKFYFKILEIFSNIILVLIEFIYTRYNFTLA